jgi:hypothetical protein
MQGETNYLELFRLSLFFSSRHPDIIDPLAADQTQAKRRRVVPELERRHMAIRTCRRCRQATCPGNSNILSCPVPCTVPCKVCNQLSGCRGVDGGRRCTYQISSSGLAG